MNPDIERLAKEAELQWLTKVMGTVTYYMASPEQLAKFAALMAEEAAKVGDQCAAQSHWTLMQRLAAESIADSIRQEFPMPGEQG